MRVEIKVYNDLGELVAEALGDGVVPLEYKTLPDRPVVEGAFKWFGFVYQPMVVREVKGCF